MKIQIDPFFITCLTFITHEHLFTNSTVKFITINFYFHNFSRIFKSIFIIIIIVVKIRSAQYFGKIPLDVYLQIFGILDKSVDFLVRASA